VHNSINSDYTFPLSECIPINSVSLRHDESSLLLLDLKKTANGSWLRGNKDSPEAHLPLTRRIVSLLFMVRK
jgi:hypothetical protein